MEIKAMIHAALVMGRVSISSAVTVSKALHHLTWRCLVYGGSFIGFELFAVPSKRSWIE